MEVKGILLSDDEKCPPEALSSKGDRDISIKTVYPGSITLKQFYIKTLHGDYESAGEGLQIANSGEINITNIPQGSVIEKAYLYWAVEGFTSQVIPAVSGKLNNVSIVPLAQLIGTSVYQDYFFFNVYRADVTGIAQFGTNVLEEFPYSVNFYPGTAGASLVVIYSNPNLPLKTIVINDGAVLFDFEPIITTLEGFVAGGTQFGAKTTYIVTAGDPGEDEADFNDEFIAGPNAFHSADGLYWDNLTVDVSDEVNPGDTSAAAKIISNGDVLVYIAQVFSITLPEPSRGIDINNYKLV